MPAPGIHIVTIAVGTVAMMCCDFVSATWPLPHWALIKTLVCCNQAIGPAKNVKISQRITFFMAKMNFE